MIPRKIIGYNDIPIFTDKLKYQNTLQSGYHFKYTAKQ